MSLQRGMHAWISSYIILLNEETVIYVWRDYMFDLSTNKPSSYRCADNVLLKPASESCISKLDMINIYDPT